ncbi:MAG: apolipoprotein N-acyltransferase [Bdellovibrionota bacterium]
MLFICSFPIAFSKTPWDITQLSPIFIVVYLLPLLSHCQKYPSYVFLKAWGFYFVGLLGILYWITISMRNYGNLSIPLSLVGLIGTCLFRGLFAATSIWLWQRYSVPKTQWMLGTALLTIQDWLLHFIPFGGFAWISSGYALIPDIYWIQCADWVGIHGLNFSVYLLTFLLFAHLQRQHKRCMKKTIPIVALVLIIHMYGFFKYTAVKHETVPATLKIGWVQGNIHQSLKWKPSEKKRILLKYRLQTEQLLLQQPDLVVWPEASVPVSQLQDAKHVHEININSQDTPVLFGAPSYTYKNRKKAFYNSAFLTKPDGEILFRYDKMYLVPFGEFVPTFGLDLSKKIPILAGSFDAGDKIEVADLKGHPFGISICYEILYPRMFRALAQKGATFFVNITNDAWFNLSSGPFQHLRFSAIRAIETRKPLIRVANTGISALYMPSGDILYRSELFSDDRRIVEIAPSDKRTFFVFFPYTAHVVVLIFISLGFLSRRHAVQRERV